MQWPVQGLVCWYSFPSRCVPHVVQGPDALHHGRYGPEGHFRSEMLAALVSEGGFHRIFMSWWAWLLFTRKSTWYFLGLHWWRLQCRNCGFSAVFRRFPFIYKVFNILVVAQMPIPLVLTVQQITEFPQLLMDKVFDVLGVRVVPVSDLLEVTDCRGPTVPKSARVLGQCR